MSTTASGPHRSFDDFYRSYLGEHRTRWCRRLHFFGTLGALFCLAKLLATLNAWWLLAALGWGYGLAWIGHFGFERNRPLSFRQPLYSFAGDWVMFRDMLFGRIPF